MMSRTNRMNNSPKRNGFKWSVNECLRLQREYELLGWSLKEIADAHGRTERAIAFKLDEQNLANFNDICPENISEFMDNFGNNLEDSDYVDEYESESEGDCSDDEEQDSGLLSKKAMYQQMVALERQVDELTKAVRLLSGVYEEC